MFGFCHTLKKNAAKPGMKGFGFQEHAWTMSLPWNPNILVTKMWNQPSY